MSADGERSLRTWVIAFEATDGAAEVAAVVVGSVLENFRGVTMAEFTDETALAGPAGSEAVDVLHEVLTSRPLTPEQARSVKEFVDDITTWEEKQ